ncbi:MAG: hypothetical protein GY937_12090 [bacterium]|nr:hypothetical protein [bacterium]
MTEHRWGLWGALAGAALGLADTWLLGSTGVEMRLGEKDATWLVALTFGFNLTLVGGLAGSLWSARERQRRDAKRIHDQQEALAASERTAFENEKLAAIGRLAAGIAHEVRNPLGVMRASAALVQEQFPEGEDAHRACAFVVEEADRLNELIRSLLAFARPTALTPRPSAIDTMVARAVALAQPPLETHDVELTRNLQSLEGLHVDADAGLVSQVLLCLLTNAAEAVGSEGHVRLEGRRDDLSLYLRVADDGPGVEPADRAKLFEPFFTTKPQGTGLGLAMAAQIARAHGGSLSLIPGAGTGANGDGACFELALPWHGKVAA